MDNKKTSYHKHIIDKYAYDEARKVLTIFYANGRIFEYFDVEKDVYTDLQQCSSRSDYVQINIIDRYSFQERTD